MKPGVDETFRAFHKDPHNLFPASGEINGDRSNLPFGQVEGEDREYGACDFEVGGEPRLAEPRILSRGELAHAMINVRDRHRVPLYLQLDELWEWHRSDLPEPCECARVSDADSGAYRTGAVLRRDGLCWQGTLISVDLIGDQIETRRAGRNPGRAVLPQNRSLLSESKLFNGREDTLV